MAIPVTYEKIKLVPVDVSTVDPLLADLLHLCTPHGYEKHIVEVINNQSFIKNEEGITRYKDSKTGSRMIRVGTEKDSRTLFSCHMDIIGDVSKNNQELGLVDHITLMTPSEGGVTHEGMIYGTKKFKYIDKEDKEVTAYFPSTLGADDKVGVFILLKMIEKRIPGYYMFHTGEETGAIGSTHIAQNMPNFLKDNFDRAIAFDRANYGDIIAFQRGGRCCSEEFGQELANRINVHLPPQEKLKNEVRGTFTDTASYMKIIPECTNISVGYFNQHGNSEHLDYYWLRDHLLPAILQTDFENLPIKRDPKKPATTTTYYGRGNGYYDNEDWSSYNNIYKNNNNIDCRVSWADATKETSYVMFPKWNPEIGFIAEAKPEVLRIAIDNYTRNIGWGSDRQKFIDYLIFQMQYTNMLEEQIKVLESQNQAFLKGKRGKVVRKQTKRNNKFAKLFAQEEEEKAEHCEVIDNSVKDNNEIIDAEFEEVGDNLEAIDEVSYTNLGQKIYFLEGLVKGTEEVQINGEYGKILGKLCMGAEEWITKLNSLNENKGTIKYTFKTTMKVNRLILSMSTIIDAGSISPTGPLAQLLMDIDKYIVDHPNEIGFEQINFANFFGRKSGNTSDLVH